MSTTTRTLDSVDYAYNVAGCEMRLNQIRLRIQRERTSVDYCMAINFDEGTQAGLDKIVALTEELEQAVDERDTCLADYLTLLGR